MLMFRGDNGKRVAIVHIKTTTDHRTLEAVTLAFQLGLQAEITEQYVRIVFDPENDLSYDDFHDTALLTWPNELLTFLEDGDPLWTRLPDKTVGQVC